MKKYTYPLIWILIGILLSILDWYDHISRENQMFKHYKLHWLLYTFLSLFVLIFVTIVFNILLSKFIKIKFIVEILSFSIATIIFKFCGKVINEITISEIKLSYKFSMIPSAILIIVYSVLYLIINYTFKKIYAKNVDCNQ
jgi:uncharacterized membrane protein YjjP (DUF1212 family)